MMHQNNKINPFCLPKLKNTQITIKTPKLYILNYKNKYNFVFIYNLVIKTQVFLMSTSKSNYNINKRKYITSNNKNTKLQ